MKYTICLDYIYIYIYIYGRQHRISGVSIEKTEYMSFNQKEDHVLTNSEGTTLKKVKDFNYLGSFIGSTAHDIDVRNAKAWGAITSMTKIWKSKLSEKSLKAQEKLLPSDR